MTSSATSVTTGLKTSMSSRLAAVSKVWLNARPKRDATHRVKSILGG